MAIRPRRGVKSARARGASRWRTTRLAKRSRVRATSASRVAPICSLHNPPNSAPRCRAARWASSSRATRRRPSRVRDGEKPTAWTSASAIGDLLLPRRRKRATCAAAPSLTSALKLQATVVVDSDGTSFHLANWDLPADRFRSSLSLTLDPMLEGLPMSTVKLLVSAQRGVRRRRARKEAERIAAEKERKRRAATAIERFARGHLARSTRTCPICYDDVPLPAFKPLNTGHPTCKREHKACSGCVRRYVETALGDGQMYVRCMHAGCKELVAHSDLTKHATPAAWRKFEEERHAAHTRRLDDEGDAAVLALAGSQLRRCPGCHVLIYRHAGCDHMHAAAAATSTGHEEGASTPPAPAAPTAAPAAPSRHRHDGGSLAALRDAPGRYRGAAHPRTPRGGGRHDAAFRVGVDGGDDQLAVGGPTAAAAARADGPPRNAPRRTSRCGVPSRRACHPPDEQAERRDRREPAASAPPPLARSASARPPRREE